MSWSFSDADFWATDFGQVYTVRVDGARWFAVINAGATALVAAPASENDGECPPTKNDDKIADLIAFARTVPFLPREFRRGELDAWCDGGGYGELAGLKINRALLASAFDALEGASFDSQWHVGISTKGDMPNAREGAPSVAAILSAGDAFAIVMGLNDFELPPRSFP